MAVTGHVGRPAIVSGGGDETALVWDVTQTKQTHRLPHPIGVSVTALATTSPQAKKQLVATGGADGKLRIWDVSNLDKLPKEPMKSLEDSHAAAIDAIAFSQDGTYLATAAGRVVYIWSVAQGKKLYALPQDHRDNVTTLHFTPQATLVTVSRDKSIRTWTLGQTGARADAVLDHRGGSVNMLGVSSDGGRMLFDKSQTRLDIVNLADQRSVATLQNYGSGTRFETLALFSPDDSLVLTGSEDSMLTVWEVSPEGGRGAERQRMMTPHGSAITCAAFSPDPANRFIVAGTSTGGVHFWETPKITENNKAMKATVVSVLPADARSVTVRVELANPEAGLRQRVARPQLGNNHHRPASGDCSCSCCRTDRQRSRQRRQRHCPSQLRFQTANPFSQQRRGAGSATRPTPRAGHHADLGTEKIAIVASDEWRVARESKDKMKKAFSLLLFSLATRHSSLATTGTACYEYRTVE